MGAEQEEEIQVKKSKKGYMEETAFELSLEAMWKLKEMTWTETQASDPLCSGNL